MRWLWLALCLSLGGCSLVVSGRTKDFEGACADEEEAVTAVYGPDARSVILVAFGCHGCADEDCVEDCMSQATQDHVTFECSACFADAVECGWSRCENSCKDADDACVKCLCDEGCAAPLDECAGMTVAACDK